MKNIKFENKIIDLLKETNDKTIENYLIPVYLYVNCNSNKFNKVPTNIEEVVKWCGLKPNAHKGKSNEIGRASCRERV